MPTQKIYKNSCLELSGAAARTGSYKEKGL